MLAGRIGSGLLYVDKHFPQNLVQGKRHESIRDKRIQWNDAISEQGCEIGLGEQRQREWEIDFTDHAVGRDDAHFTRHNLPQ